MNAVLKEQSLAEQFQAYMTDKETSLQKTMNAMKESWVAIFTPRDPLPPIYDPIFSYKDQVAYMVHCFDKKQQKIGFTSNDGHLDRPTLELAMAEYFTEFFKYNDTNGRHKLTIISQELAKDDVRATLATRAYNSDKNPKIVESIGIQEDNIPTLTDIVELGDKSKIESALQANDNIPTLTDKVLPEDKIEFVGGTNLKASSLDIASAPTNPVITNFTEAVSNFSFKKFAQSKMYSITEGTKALKQAFKDDPKGMLKSAILGAGTGIALKAAFNTAAAASGVGLIAVVGYGLTKTFKDEYTKSKAEGRSVWQALKDAGNTKVDLALLKNSAKHSLLFGLGIGAGIGASELIPETVETVSVQENIINDTPIEEITITVESGLTAEEMAVPSVLDEVTPESVEETIISELSPFEIAMTELGDNSSPQDIKDAAVEQLWSDGGNQEVGVQLMQEAAKMGNIQAIRDMADLQEMGMAPSFSVDEQLASINVPDEIQARLDSSNVSTSSQALNDVAIGALGSLHGDHGIDKNFPLGIGILERLAQEGHAKSIKDLYTLTDLGMVDASKLSSDVQMKLGIADGALASCSQTISPCEFADGVPEKLKDALSQTFEKAMETGDIDKEVTSFYQAPNPNVVVASVN